VNQFDKIRQWANDRNIVAGGTPQAQMLKLTEEVGELAAAVARGKIFDAADGIGDAVVVLTILAAQLDLSIESCIDHAWYEIKDRKGRLVDGVFIKEESLDAALMAAVVYAYEKGLKDKPDEKAD